MRLGGCPWRRLIRDEAVCPLHQELRASKVCCPFFEELLEVGKTQRHQLRFTGRPGWTDIKHEAE